MNPFRNPELKGIITLIAIIIVIGFVFAGISGKLEQWFNITWFSGGRVSDKIIFVSDRSGAPDIYLMNHDGGNQQKITTGSGVIDIPAVSPSGTRILFVALTHSGAQIFSINGKGGGMQQITTSTGAKSQPQYSPDGKTLSYIVSGKVFTAQINGDSPDYVLPTHKDVQTSMTGRTDLPAYSSYSWDADSTGLMGATTGPNDMDVLVYLPKPGGDTTVIPVSPEASSRIAGISRSDSSNSYVVSINTSKDAVLLLIDADNGSGHIVAKIADATIGAPVFAPGGSQAVVTINAKRGAGLVLFNTDNGEPKRLAEGQFENPSYSPDGEQIVVTKIDEDGNKNVVLIDSYSGSVKQVTKDGKSYNAIYAPASKKK